MGSVFRKYLLPGFVFQSVLIGGGYGTGREIAEFFMTNGSLGGFLGMGVSALVWSALLALAFEFARLNKLYDYRAFFRALIGPFWRLFEVAFILLAFLVLAVIGAAAGELVSTALGVPPIVGTLVLLFGVAIVTYLGSALIEAVLSAWSVLLYAVYGALVIWVLKSDGHEVVQALATGGVGADWAVDGLRYAAYSLAVLAPVLFALRHIETRTEAVTAGAMAGLIGVAPATFVYAAMLSQYPEIVDAPVPIIEILSGLSAPWFIVVFQVVLFGTFVETGVGIIHAINERLAANFEERGKIFPKTYRLTSAVILMVAALFLAERFGIISLIAKGYGALSYAFVALVVLPLIIVIPIKIFRASRVPHGESNA